MTPIYLDNAATTRLHPKVLEAMLPWLKDNFGNASSAHQLGQRATVAVEHARETIANYFGVEGSEIVFTSGGTESNNAVLRGVVEATGKHHIISDKIEHHAVLHPIQHSGELNISGTFIDVDHEGNIDPTNIQQAINGETALVSIMLVNNEIGTINPIERIGAFTKSDSVLFHTDAVQAVGKTPISVDKLGVDFLSVSAHKFYGPQGVGALYIRGGSDWKPFIEGGAQERRRRGGTLNVAGIVGLGAALEIAMEEMEDDRSHILSLKKQLVEGLKSAFDSTLSFNGNPDETFFNIVNASFTNIDGEPLDGEMLLLNLDMEDVCLSNGSACTSGAIEPSHVLMALGKSEAEAKSSLRFSIGKYNTSEEIDLTLERLSKVIQRMQRKK